jgi:hypothetical protein
MTHYVTSDRSDYLYVLAAVCAGLALAVAIGLGRFGFTAVAPLMVREGTMDLRGEAVAQAVHFLGYFAGALAVVRVPPRRVAMACAAGLVASALMLAATAFSITAGWICVDRFLSGAASGVVMVMASTWLFQIAGTKWAPLLYSGAGLGIVTAAESVAMLSRHGTCGKSAWLMLAWAAGALMVPALAALGAKRFHARGPELVPPSRPDINPARLVIVYAAGGFGYVITATYLPALVAQGALQLNPIHVFAVFGLCAIPSCFIWLRVDTMLGTRRALAMNYGIQTLGTVIAMVSSHPAALLVATAAIGGTFMGVVAMAMAAGRRHAPGLEYNLLAVLTAAYALGQAFGPAASALVSGPVINLNASLGLAAVTLLAATAVAWAPDSMARRVCDCRL